MSASLQVLSMIDALNRGDIDAAIAYFDDAAENHGRRVGPEGMRAVFEAQRIAFDDWHHEVVQTLVDGTTVATRSILSGVHRGTLPEPMVSLLFNGALRGIVPTQRTVRIQAIHIWEVGSDGLIHAHWANRDDLGMRAQLSSGT
ncbi:MAG TPA: ester cyclase [Candidatus Limnocylindrales bacterium]|nr:ester cyclase [Candidatus Limnocylindrales bacterium]